MPVRVLDGTVGAICLCTMGCALRIWLVVSGPERGQMWDDYSADGADLGPLFTTFGDCYLEWLGEATRKAHGQ